jgi:hypothetical protein
MNIPEEFAGRICKTKLSGMSSSFKKLDQLIKEWPGSEIDVVFENREKALVVIVFETTEDCLAFKLKYGNDYV